MDTIVVFEDEILHKPKTAEEAKAHLRKLSGKKHDVLTGVVTVIFGGEFHFFTECTTVQFNELTDELIDAYVASGDPFDKAGGYGIQTLGALLVKSIEGDYNNVVGLPLAHLFDELVKLDIVHIQSEVEQHVK